jgi:hypothetical protein
MADEDRVHQVQMVEKPGQVAGEGVEVISATRQLPYGIEP